MKGFRVEAVTSRPARAAAPEILELSDLIRKETPDAASRVGFKFGMMKTGKARAGAKTNKKNVPLVFLNSTMSHRVPNGWLYPMLAAFRANVEWDLQKRKFEWKVPLAKLVGAVIDDLVGICVTEHRDNNLQPDKVGKRESTYVQCYDKIQLYLLESGQDKESAEKGGTSLFVSPFCTIPDEPSNLQPDQIGYGDGERPMVTQRSPVLCRLEFLQRHGESMNWCLKSVRTIDGEVYSVAKRAPFFPRAACLINRRLTCRNTFEKTSLLTRLRNGRPQIWALSAETTGNLCHKANHRWSSLKVLRFVRCSTKTNGTSPLQTLSRH